MSKIVKLVGKTLNGLSYIAPKFASKKALDLFSTPRKGRVNAYQETFLESATKAIIKYNHLDVATYVWKGTNKKILLAHGWESNTSRWNTLIEDLKKDQHTIIALDAPAHGNTSGKFFNAILYAECIGHSVGGMATGFYQYKYQNKHLEKLILLGAPSEFTGVFKRYVDMLGYNSRIENGLNTLVEERFNQKPEHFSLANFSKTIDTKALLIHDENDNIIPYEDAKLIDKNYKNATLISTKGLGHGLKSEAINKHITSFINEA
jgi:pimeloyl-ACP methyl ester carboxylesterase